MTDFLKIIIPVLADTPVTQRSPCYSAVSSSLTNPLPDRSNYSPFCHTHYLTPAGSILPLVSLGQTLYQASPLETNSNTSLLQRFTAESSRNSGETQCFEEAEQQTEASVDVPYPPLQFSFVSILSIFILSLLPFSILSLLPLHHPFFLF